VREFLVLDELILPPRPPRETVAAPAS
jgi:hypothetical protein